MTDTDRSHEPRAESVPDPTPESTTAGPSKQRWFVPILQRYGVVVAWLIVIVVFSILRPEHFPTTANLRTILASQAVLLMVALALIVSLAAGEFDLSVGAVVGFASIIVAYLNGSLGWPIGLAIVIVLLIAAVFGAINAFLAVRVGVPSIIVTLGMGTLLTGVGLGLSGSRIISGVSSDFVQLVNRRILLGLPVTFYLGLVIAAIVWFVFQQTPLGRYLFFISESREVARLAGIRVNLIRGGSLIVTSTLAGLAGVALVGALGAADPTVGNSYLLPTFAAAFLGSTTIVPGRFNAVGTVVAVYFLVTGITGLQLMGFAGWIEQVFYGGSLVLAVTLSQLAGRDRAGLRQ